MYRLHSEEMPLLAFSRSSRAPVLEGAREGGKDELEERRLSLSGTPVAVRDRGRERGVVLWRSGVVGEVLDGEGWRGVGVPEAATVW